jgi:hypothetical protein
MTAFPCFAMCGDPACEKLGCVRVYNDRHRVRMDLSRGGHMDVTVADDVSQETLNALRALGEAALNHMEEPVTDLIGKKATIVGYSETGDEDGPELGFVAHVCLDIEDGPRIFFQATDTKATWRIVEEPRA